MLLSRVADHLYWAARYAERAQCTARLVRTYTELMVDLPSSVLDSWAPLLVVAGSEVAYEARAGGVEDEASIIAFLLADLDNPASLASSVARARENMRVTREIMPREAWQRVNDLHHYVVANAPTGCARANRARFLNRVIADGQQLDGILATVMLRDEAHEMWQLGEAIERADMTTRVVGVRAAALLDERSRPDLAPEVGAHDDVQWMGLLRSVSALQMYQRARRGTIDAASAIGFLVHEERFPRSVAAGVARIRQSLARLPHRDLTDPVVEALSATLTDMAGISTDGAALDAAMERVQRALAALDAAVYTTFVVGRT